MKNHRYYPLFLLLFLGMGCGPTEMEMQDEILATGYDRHVELNWPKQENAISYHILASSDGNNFTRRATVEDTIYLDFVNDLGTNLSLTYEVMAVDSLNEEIPIGTVNVTTKDLSDEELLDMVQYYTFRYFWEGAEPTSGLGRERIHMDGVYPQDDQNVVTTGGSGFGLFGILSGIERGWVTRQEGADRFEGKRL